MKTFLLSLALAIAISAATPPKKKISGTASKHATSSHAPLNRASGTHTAPTPSRTAHLSASRRKAITNTSALAGVTGPRNHQAVPSTDRYKEIQQALVSKGYLKTEPNGVWDAQSTEALKQFQTDQKLDPSGKLNAPSLIGLGLGPASPSAPAQTPALAVPSPTPQ